jgi:hypothetical protein
MQVAFVDLFSRELQRQKNDIRISGDRGDKNFEKKVCEQYQDETSWSCTQAVSKTVWRILLLCVQWKTSDYEQRNCPKHVDFPSKNKFGKLVYLIGFIIWNLSRCMDTWTSNLPTLFIFKMYNFTVFIKSSKTRQAHG